MHTILRVRSSFCRDLFHEMFLLSLDDVNADLRSVVKMVEVDDLKPLTVQLVLLSEKQVFLRKVHGYYAFPDANCLLYDQQTQLQPMADLLE